MVSRRAAAVELQKRRQARLNLIDFIEYVWWKPWGFIRGTHTVAVCNAIDTAIENYLEGKSSYLDIAIPFRHGKSDIVSRALPPYFLGRCIEQHPEIIMTGYGAALVEDMSKDAKRLIKSPAYKNLFPNIEIPRGEDQIAEWGIEGSTGRVNAVGLGGGMTGKGATLLIVDDYCKSRAEARSEVYRNSTWDAFVNEAMTRLGPVHIVIVCATPWHIDDVRGRIFAREKADEDFPKFEHLKFPACKVGGGYLFEERYPDEWYRTQYASLGKWSTGLLDCEPVHEGGNRFRVDGIKIYETEEAFPNVPYRRVWDLASTKKQRDKDDPDYTVGLLGAITTEKNGQKHLWIKNAVVGQWEAPARNEQIRTTALKDGQAVTVHIEAFGAYKDAYTELKRILSGLRIVRKSILPGDKSAKCADLEPIFEVGNVHLLKAEWNKLFVKHFREFPDGTHDDFCDAAAIIYHEAERKKSTVIPIG